MAVVGLFALGSFTGAMSAWYLVTGEYAKAAITGVLVLIYGFAAWMARP